MAETAPAEASAALSPTGIKREPMSLDGFDFSIITDTASKRPLESAEVTTNEPPEAKRLKTEDGPPENAYEDEMSLLVQNALSNINDIIGQFSEEPDGAHAVPTAESGATNGAPAHDVQPTPVGFMTDPTKFVRNSNIDALATIAISMLLILAHNPFDELAAKMRDPESEQRRRFQQLQKSFHALRDLYSDGPILLADEFDPHKAGTIVQFANLAQLGSWLLEGGPDSLRDAESHLPAVFRDEILGLPRWICDLWVGLRTHKAIQALQARDDKKLSEEELTGIFTADVAQKLHDNNIANQIIGSEQTVIDCLQLRMDELKGLGPDTILSAKYPVDDLLRSLGQYSRNQLSTATELGERLGFTMPPVENSHTHSVEPVSADPGLDGMDIDDLSSFFEKTASGLVESALAGLDADQLQPPPVQNGEHTTTETVNGTSAPEEVTKTNGFITDYKELEALVAESTNNYVKTTLQGLSPTPYQPTVPTSTTESMAAQPHYTHHNIQHPPQNSYYTFPQATQEQEHLPPPPAPGQTLPPNQSCSSAMLYEKARQAALSRQTAHTRREGLHSTRRPWSQEEEKALMTGLDMVKGPHWSQILSLFGHNGTISDVLKDRTQVQLKDKARNLKLFFLKTNSEMPFYLNSVTGELKTRAPTQAARKEAEERARLSSEDDHSKLQGIMALTGGGLQHAQQNRAQGGAVGPGVVTPAQAAAQAAAAGQHRAPGQTSVSTTTTANSTSASTPTSQARPQGQTPGQQHIQSMPHPPPRPQNQFPPQIPRPQPQPQRPAQPAGQTTGQYGNQQTIHQNGHQHSLPHSPQQPTTQQAQTVHQQAPVQASPPPPQPQQQQQQPQQPQQQQHQQQPQQHQQQAAPSQQTHNTSTPTSMPNSGRQSPTAGPPPSAHSHYQHQPVQHTSQSPALGPQATHSPATSVPPPATDATAQQVPPETSLELDNETEAALIRDLQAAVAQATSS